MGPALSKNRVRGRLEGVVGDGINVGADDLRDDDRVAYAARLKHVFGFDVAPSDVRFRFLTWELAWDRICLAALHAPSAFEYPWRTVFPFAMRSWGDERATYLEHSADLSHADIDGVRGTGYLRGRTIKGSAAKLYAKKHWLLKFEAVLDARPVRAIL